MLIGIPLTTWLLYIAGALLQIYWSLLAIFNSFDSYLGFRFQVRKLITERDGYKQQAERYAELLSQCQLCLGIVLAANEYLQHEFTVARDEANNQHNRADGLEDIARRQAKALDTLMDKGKTDAS